MKKLLTLVFLFSLPGFSQATLVTAIPALNESTGFQCIEFFDDNNGYVIQGTALLMTNDGGLSWTTVYDGLSGYYSDGAIVYGSDFNHMFLIGSWGGGIRTTNGGETFEAIPGMATSQQGHFYFRDNLNGYFTSRLYLSTNYWRTTDGGNTWTSQFNSSGVKCVEFPVANSPSGIMICGNNVYNTTNGGASWTMVATPSIPGGGYMNNYYSSQFFDLQNGLLLSQYNMIKTTNGGLTWTLVGDRGGSEISFIDQNVGYLVSNSPENQNSTTALYKTYNGGQTWGTIVLEAFEGSEQLVDISVPKGSIGYGYALTSYGKLYKFNLSLNAEQEKLEPLALWPNPAKESLNVASEDHNAKPYVVYDMIGRKILDGVVDAKKVDISTLEDGYYFLKLDGIQAAKFKKE